MSEEEEKQIRKEFTLLRNQFSELQTHTHKQIEEINSTLATVLEKLDDIENRLLES